MGIVGDFVNELGNSGSKHGRLLLTIGSICGVWVGGSLVAYGAVKLHKELEEDKEMSTKDKIKKGVVDLGPGIAVMGLTTAGIVCNHKLSSKQIAGGIVAGAYVKERVQRAKAEKELKEATTKKAEKSEEQKSDVPKEEKPLWKDEFTGQFFRADANDIRNAVDRAVAKKTASTIDQNSKPYNLNGFEQNFKLYGVVKLNDILTELNCEPCEAADLVAWKLNKNEFPVPFGIKPGEEPELGIDSLGNTYRVLQFTDYVYPHWTTLDDDDD